MKTCHQILFIILSIALFGCEELINEADISEATVALTAPADGAVLTETDIVLSWESVAGADEYHIQIAQPSFEAALQIVKDSVVSGNHFPVSLDTNDYEWRVKARNSAYETGFSTQSFTIN